MDTINSYNELLSVDPPTKGMTMTCFVYMVPPHKPESVLMLGYAGGTVAGLIRLLYGDVPITAVDTKDYGDKYGVNFVKADALEYVKNCQDTFDTIIVDLFPDGTYDVCDFVLTPAFTEHLARLGSFIIVNTVGEMDMSAYDRFTKLGMNRPTGHRNRIYYYAR